MARRANGANCSRQFGNKIHFHIVDIDEELHVIDFCSPLVAWAHADKPA